MHVLLQEGRRRHGPAARAHSDPSQLQVIARLLRGQRRDHRLPEAGRRRALASIAAAQPIDSDAHRSFLRKLALGAAGW